MELACLMQFNQQYLNHLLRLTRPLNVDLEEVV